MLSIKASEVNWDVNGLNQNPSSSDEDIIGVLGMEMWIWKQY
jgi:hypothetical protein